MSEDSDPLDWLPEKEREVMNGILAIIEATITDKDLKEQLVGGILVTIDEWGQERLKDLGTENPQ